MNKKVFEERLEKKNCNMNLICVGKLLVYYCVMFKGMFIEVCVFRVFIIGIWIVIVYIGIFNII